MKLYKILHKIVCIEMLYFIYIHNVYIIYNVNYITLHAEVILASVGANA